MRDHTVTIDTGRTPTGIAFAPNFNCSRVFVDRHLEEGRGARVFARSFDDEITYADLAENQNRAGNLLRSLGLAPGDRVAMVVADCPEFFYVFWGAIKAGFVPVPINTLLKSHDYRFMFEDSGCRAVIYSAAVAGEVEPALAAAGLSEIGLRVEGEGRTLRALLAAAPTALDRHPATATDDCFWLYSSGSTGNPKGAVHRHRDMVVAAQYYAVDALGMTAEDVSFSAPKLFFAYGLGCTNYFPLWIGSQALFMTGPPTPETVFDMIERFRPTLFFGVPTLYAGALQALNGSDRELGSLRACVSGGEALPGDLLRRWREKVGVDIYDGIGSTEATHIFIGNRPGDLKPGSTGRVVPGYAARIVGPDGADLPANRPGRLWIKGESTAAYYWNNPDKTAATMRGEWLDTGDTFARDEEGYFYFHGRSDDMLKVGGIWTSPFEIEDRLIAHPKVLEAAVIGRADDAGMIKPAAYVVPANGAEPGDALAGELLDHCKAGLAKYKYPRWIEFVDDLPKTATGKIRRFKLRAG